MIDLEVSRLARTDLLEIFTYFGAKDMRATAKLVATVIDRIEILRTHARIGRPGRVRGTRELVLADTQYIAAYRIRPSGDVVVLRVLHAARRWPKRL